MRKWWTFVGVLLLMVCGNICVAYGEMCNHSVICDNPAVCINCYAIIEDDAVVEIYHTGYGYVNLGEQHRYQCLGCGEGIYAAENHQVYCDARTECITCSETIEADVAVEIYHTGYGYVNLGEQHQYQCLGCGEGIYAAEDHQVYCDARTECIRCSETIEADVAVEIYHTEYGYVNLGEQHQYQCLGCGEGEYDAEDHRVYCDARTECVWCGASDLVIEESSLKHVGDRVLVDVGDCHQLQCSMCGSKTGEPEKHWAMCDAPNHCNKCGLDGVTIDEDYLYHDGSKYVDLGTEHQEVCVSCNYAFDSATSHQGYCSEPNYCIICELSGVIIDANSMQHNWFDELVSLDGQHQYQCTCGAEKNEPEDCQATCTEAWICYTCGARIPVVSKEYQTHVNRIYQPLGAYCRLECLDCGYIGKPQKHFAPCNYDLRCVLCDSQVWEYTYHTDARYVDLGDMHQYICLCGYSEPAEEHYGTCIEPTICYICKVEGLNGDAKHVGTFTDMGDQHHFECDHCSYTIDEQHWVICTDQSACYHCGKTGFEVTWKNRYCTGVEYQSFSSDNHTFYCNDCKETYTEPHDDIEVGEKCLCGYVKERLLPGDASGDNTVSLADAIAILSGEVSSQTNADVNDDGEVDELDALLIMQYDAGWDVILK